MGLFRSNRSDSAGALQRWGWRRELAGDTLARFTQRAAAWANAEVLKRDLPPAVLDGFALTAAALYLQRADGSFYLANASGVIAAPPQLPQIPSSSPATPVVRWEDVCPNSEPLVAETTPQWRDAVPFYGESNSLGLIALGPKRSGAELAPAEKAVLALLGVHAASTLQGDQWLRQIEKQRIEIESLQRRLQAETAVVHTEVRCIPTFPFIVGTSPVLNEALILVEKMARTEATVLITGETGTGKELIARAIHELSARRSAPLVSVNCPAIPLELAESELFGHERGAFTGAVETRIGKMEMADGGTIFLDEVADLPMAVQVKLLRVLQEREVQRVGSQRTRRLDLRVIAATNRDLLEAVQMGSFREDLYYRLAAMPVQLPPLRDRTGDVRILASHFLEKAAEQYEKSVRGMTTEALAALENYSWPGNVRELQHVIERAVLLCTTDRLQLRELSGIGSAEPYTHNLSSTLSAEKRRRVESALLQSNGNQAAAARLLGMSRSNFARLMKALGVRPPQPRAA